MLEMCLVVVILIDFLGGILFRILMIVVSNYLNVEVLVGINLLMVFEGFVLCIISMNVEDFVLMVIDLVRDGIVYKKLE